MFTVVRALFQNPLNKNFASRHHLFKWGYFPLYLLLILAGIASVIPSFFYITESQSRLLAAIAVFVYAAHFAIILHTLILSTSATSQLSQPITWESLVLTKMDGKKIVLGQWFSLVRRVWFWHGLVGLMKTGVALGFAQHIHNAVVRGACGSPLESLCYVELSGVPYYSNPVYFTSDLSPSLKKILIVLLITFGIGVLEAGLSVAIGVLAGLMARTKPLLQVGLAVSVRSLLPILPIIALIAINPRLEYLRDDWARQEDMYSQRITYLGWFDLRDELPLLEASSVGWMGLADGGLLASTNILRPYVPSRFNVMRGIWSAALGASLYVISIYGMLWLARQQAVQHGAAWPPKSKWRGGLPKFFQNPLIRFYWRYLRRNRSIWSSALLLCVVFAALLYIGQAPRLSYMDYAKARRVFTLFAATYALNFLIGLRTLFIAANSFKKIEYSGIWELLIIADLNPKRLIIGQWWAIFRYVLPYHLMGAFVRLGSAYAMTQFLHSYRPGYPVKYSLPQWFDRLGSPFYYISYNDMSNFFTYYPSLELIVRAGAVLVLFGLFEAALLTAFGLCSGFVIRKSTPLHFVFSVLLRSFPILIFALFLKQTSHQNWGYLSEGWGCCGTQAPNRFVTADEAANRLKALETEQILATTQIDGGVMFSANLMRVPHLQRDFFMARHLFIMVTGLMLYFLMTILALRLTQQIAIRRGVSPPD